VKKVLFAVMLVACFVTVAMAADRAPASIGATTRIQGHWSATSQNHNPSVSYCSGASCLYYAGDFDSNNTGADGVCDANNPGLSSECWLWVGVKPKKNSTVKGSTFNILVYTTSLSTTTTPFQVQTGITAGNAGTVVCNTTGKATETATGRTGFGLPEYSLTVKKLKKACSMKKGTIYFVNLQPQYNDSSSWDFVSDVEDIPAMNHKGWATVEDDTYMDYPGAGYSYYPTWGSSGVCGGLGCDAFSIALTGK